MSKVIVYVLDKFVWILLVAVITTQALQIAGVVEGPKTLGEITYEKDNELEFKVTAGNPRGKRQSDERFALFDNIFNIPIATLNSVNELLQATRRLRLSNRNAAAAAASSYNSGNANASRVPRKTKKRNYYDGPRVQEDGSSARVLLNI
ncbi:hypothetical protein PPYR_07471 [Photinus pyralis]|uniref:Uncharacterized protein n=2 Tax=Photinus pyralis TaxID=7054 RepID=A0A5N4AQJ9_PHOPY|nr:uncharacterized protein LOC116168356 isoform X1 [Photinus pyralis]XP_031340003.1 uncharacterized protein LOC116168356 isoform X1 [Photinus pyralis]KAB0799591.1 hypothetical protein PPYR_07471 [Photinus pyralis]